MHVHRCSDASVSGLDAVSLIEFNLCHCLKKTAIAKDSPGDSFFM